MKGDIGEAFDKLNDSLYVKYNGALIEKTGRPDYPYSWNGELFKTIESAQSAIDDTYGHLTSSIK